MKDSRKTSSLSGTFKAGAVSLAFIIIGYQSALFMNRATELRIAQLRDKPDTVYIVRSEAPSPSGSPQDSGPADTVRHNAPHSPRIMEARSRMEPETFRFDPNTASLDDLMRLGFSSRQAQSIINYRSKGGRFHRKGDFAESYVVSQAMFQRLEPFIDIPLLDINAADSAAFDALPGIGPWFAAQMVEYRSRLRGYSYTEQLMDIYRFDRERYDGLKDLITCSVPEPYPLWTLPEDELRKHPYIRNAQAARGIILYRDNTPGEERSTRGILEAGILDREDALKLLRCVIASPADGD